MTQKKLPKQALLGGNGDPLGIVQENVMEHECDSDTNRIRNSSNSPINMEKGLGETKISKIAKRSRGDQKRLVVNRISEKNTSYCGMKTSKEFKNNNNNNKNNKPDWEGKVIHWNCARD